MTIEPALVIGVSLAVVNVCTRLVASKAWQEEESMHPQWSAIIRAIASFGPDIIGGMRELWEVKKALAPAPKVEDADNDNMMTAKGPDDAA